MFFWMDQHGGAGGGAGGGAKKLRGPAVQWIHYQPNGDDDEELIGAVDMFNDSWVARFCASFNMAKKK